MSKIKNFLKIMVCVAWSACFTACSEDDESEVQEFEATPAYLNGTWMLAEWNGNPLADGLYLYITFNRRDFTYEMYHNFDSMYARFITGTYAIEKDGNFRYVISGDYDYGRGEWSNEYFVIDRYEDTMTWIPTDDEGDVQRFVRCEKIPDEVLDEVGEEPDGGGKDFTVAF